jgi:hypothetical protein
VSCPVTIRKFHDGCLSFLSEAGTACCQSWFVKRRRKKSDCGSFREDVLLYTVLRMVPKVTDLRTDTFWACMEPGCDAMIVVAIVDVKLWKYFWGDSGWGPLGRSDREGCVLFLLWGFRGEWVCCRLVSRVLVFMGRRLGSWVSGLTCETTRSAHKVVFSRERAAARAVQKSPETSGSLLMWRDFLWML